ncbi:hypothetical protein AB6A40_000723 [Gnathostoma spinigerum]|uniref:Ribosomal protein S14 n=1 Tax=Gnathostoma spinigerum TaxID=75299 RepID=A0ABD6E9H8_9BILA
MLSTRKSMQRKRRTLQRLSSQYKKGGSEMPFGIIRCSLTLVFDVLRRRSVSAFIFIVLRCKVNWRA